MTAEEARALAYKKNTADTDSQFAEVMSRIEVEAKKGEYRLRIDWVLHPDVTSKIESLGYVTEAYGGIPSEGTCTTISWVSKIKMYNGS